MEAKGEHRILDVYANLSTYIPAIFFLINDKRFFKKVILRHQERILNHGFLGEDGKSHFNFTCFLDMIFRAVAGDYSSALFLLFLDSSVQDINLKVDAINKLKFRDKLKNLISNFDLNRSYHLDWVGEILLYQLILKSGYLQVDLERKLANGKSIDFVIKTVGGNEFYIEAFSIDFRGKHLSTDQVIGTIQDRISRKIEDKTIMLDNASVMLQVILWAEPMFIIEKIESLLNADFDGIGVQFTVFFNLYNNDLQKSLYYFAPIENLYKFLPIQNIDELAKNLELFENSKPQRDYTT